MKSGLLGRKLGHSYSPQIHRCFGDYAYNLFEKEPEQIGDFLKHGDFDGINVTIPYKKDVIPFCAELSDTARKMGAVNTIVRRGNILVGHNTDYFGFSSMVYRSGLTVEEKKVLVLGSGGASLTAQKVLAGMGARVVVISRSGSNHYGNLHLHTDASIIVNCTPVGMYPHNGVSPIDLTLFPKLEGILDMIYNPARTKLLLDAEARGLIVENGLWMLVAQAKESAEWFLGHPLPDSIISKTHQELTRKMQNIVLIGMPGSGKSTVGKLLSERLGRDFVDADEEICKKAGCTIPEIFRNGGEALFRTTETEVLRELGKQSGKIIATGGGCVTRGENYAPLHQNGTIVWLKRDLSALPSDGRPLSQVTKMEDMYRIREPLYSRFADFVVMNDGTTEQTVQAILQTFQ